MIRSCHTEWNMTEHVFTKIHSSLEPDCSQFGNEPSAYHLHSWRTHQPTSPNRSNIPHGLELLLSPLSPYVAHIPSVLNENRL